MKKWYVRGNSLDAGLVMSVDTGEGGLLHLAHPENRKLFAGKELDAIEVETMTKNESIGWLSVGQYRFLAKNACRNLHRGDEIYICHPIKDTDDKLIDHIHCFVVVESDNPKEKFPQNELSESQPCMNCDNILDDEYCCPYGLDEVDFDGVEINC